MQRRQSRTRWMPTLCLEFLKRNQA
jgi:hypothetical protein